jgi:hypothetical protein
MFNLCVRTHSTCVVSYMYHIQRKHISTEEAEKIQQENYRGCTEPFRWLYQGCFCVLEEKGEKGKVEI